MTGVPPDMDSCPHGKRAGTTVCLYCRQDARMAARHRRNKTIVRFSVATLGIGAVVALAIGALVAIVPRQSSDVTAELQAAPVAVTQPETRESAQVVRPIIAEGRTELGDSIFAMRSGGDIVVHFDTELLRTRFDEKFERIVRMTLPRIFGPEVGARLDSVSPGQFVRGGNLLTELPERGIPLALPMRGRTLVLYPMTRPGLDGPLVVAYRATITR